MRHKVCMRWKCGKPWRISPRFAAVSRRSSASTAIPGTAAIASGIVAIGAGIAQAILAPQPLTRRRSGTSTSGSGCRVSACALAINYGAIVAWRARHRDAQAAVQFRTVGMSIVPALAAGGVITLALLQRGLDELLPGHVVRDLRARPVRVARDGSQSRRRRGRRRSARRRRAASHSGARAPSARLVGHAGRVRPRADRDRRDRPAPILSTERNPVPMKSPAPFAYEGLERIFHERGRLAVCTCLDRQSRRHDASPTLQEACALTDGNFNRHLHALAEVGVVTLERVTRRGRPTTTVRITEDGRATVPRLHRRTRSRSCATCNASEPSTRTDATGLATQS